MKRYVDLDKVIEVVTKGTYGDDDYAEWKVGYLKNALSTIPTINPLLWKKNKPMPYNFREDLPDDLQIKTWELKREGSNSREIFRSDEEWAKIYQENKGKEYRLREVDDSEYHI